AGMFAIRGTTGQVIAASPRGFGDTVLKWPAATDEANYFRFSGYESKNYNGLSIELPTAAGPMWISVARPDGSAALIESILREFAFDVIWVSPLFMIATLGISVLAIRNGLKPVRQISQMASSIGPNAMSVRLPEHNLPTEISPLVV